MELESVGVISDVLQHMDTECSGKRTCSVRIPDTELDANKDCPEEFKTYLNASYKCVKGKHCTHCAHCKLIDTEIMDV